MRVNFNGKYQQQTWRVNVPIISYMFVQVEACNLYLQLFGPPQNGDRPSRPDSFLAVP